TTVDQGTIETKVDNFAADVNSELGATTTTTTSSTTTTTGACCGINPTRLNFTTAVGSGNCGNLVTSTGGLLERLACGGVHTSGSADCSTGASALSLPVNHEIFLDGDLFPNAPGIQSCPVCNQTCTGGSNTAGPCNSNADCPSGGTCGGSVVCHGGPNNGMPCTPADSALSPSY